ncbi:hypothetical protein OAS60_00945 [Candidatus Pelagibacter sp.]|nr:hypothetical protein [Candidatus Pelagibacter sp.]
MKLEINLKSLTILFLLTCITLVGMSTILEARPANHADPITRADAGDLQPCSETEGELDLPGTTSCEVTPDTQIVTFFRLDVCKSEPTGPTRSTAADLASGDCFTFYRDDEGNDARVVLNNVERIGDSDEDYSQIPVGNYPFAIATLGSVLKFTTTATFAGNMNDGTNSDSARCVTRVSSLTTTYGVENRINTEAEQNVICDDSQVASEIQVGINTLTMSGNNCYHTRAYQSTNGVIDTYLTEADGTLQDNVVESGSNLGLALSGTAGCTDGTVDATIDHEIARVVGVMELGLPLVITNNTTALRMRFNNQRSLRVDINTGTANKFNKFDSAFFDFDLIAVD